MAPRLRKHLTRADRTDNDEEDNYGNEERNVEEAVGTPDSQYNHRNSIRKRKKQRKTKTPSSLERLLSGNRGESNEEDAIDHDDIENTNMGYGRIMTQAGEGYGGMPLSTAKPPTTPRQQGAMQHPIELLMCHPAPAGTTDCCHLPSHNIITIQTPDVLQGQIGLTTKMKALRILRG